MILRGKWLLLTVTVLLVAGNAIGVISARAIGQNKPVQMVDLFSAPDGRRCPQSCLFGVMPGVTTVTQAITLLKAHPITRGFHLISEQPFRLEGRAGRILMVTFNPAPDGVLVDEITITSYVRYGSVKGELQDTLPPASNLGEALSLLGEPDFLLLTTGGDPLLVFTESRIALSLLRGQMPNRHMAPRTTISRLTVFRYIPCTQDAFEYVFQNWRGLTSLRGYFRAKTLYLMVRRMASAGPSFAPCEVIAN